MRWRRRRSGADHGPALSADQPGASGRTEERPAARGAECRPDAQVGTEPDVEAPEPGAADLVDNAELVIARLGPHVDFPFGWDRRSLVWVEGFLERQRRDPAVDAEALVSVLGSFLGQCLITAGGGRWVERPEGWRVSSPRVDAFPFAKVEKQARHGLAGGDSIVSFYDLTLEIAQSPFPDEDGT